MILLLQIPGGPPPTTEVGALAQLLFAFASVIGVLAFVILKLMERKEQRSGKGPSNGALARLDGLDKELLAVEKRGMEALVQIREDIADFQSDVHRKFDRWDEFMLDWTREQARRSPEGRS